MLLHIRVLHQLLLHPLLHLRPLARGVQRGDALDVLDVEAEVRLLRLVNGDVELRLTPPEDGHAQDVLCV